MQFMPADMAWRPWRRRRAFLVTCCYKEVEHRPVRVGGDTEAADAGNILGGTVNRATGCLGALCIDIDIIDQDIAGPGRPGALRARPRESATARRPSSARRKEACRSDGPSRNPSHPSRSRFDRKTQRL